MLKKLREVDLNRLTLPEALNLLAELKKEIEPPSRGVRREEQADHYKCKQKKTSRLEAVKKSSFDPTMSLRN